MEYVLLVDEKDNEIGVMEKLQAHQEALLHRAISIFVFNDQQQLLLQKRAGKKYHSPLLWTNTCCSHPRPGEVLIDAAHRRLREEMNMSCELTHQFSFIYKAVLDDGLTEHELDHVFFGYSNELPVPDAAEVADWKYLSLNQIREELQSQPELYTSWFKIVFDQINSIQNERIN